MNLKQLLKNYLFMLEKEVVKTPKSRDGNVEFFNNEIARVKLALKKLQK